MKTAISRFVLRWSFSLNVTSSACSPLCNKLDINVSSIHGPPLICRGYTALDHASDKVAKLRQGCEKVCQVYKIRFFLRHGS